MDRLPSSKVLGTFRDFKKGGMTETSRLGWVTDDGELGFTVRSYQQDRNWLSSEMTSGFIA
jgi:hypothetical protein